MAKHIHLLLRSDDATQDDALEWLDFSNGAQPEHCSAAIFKR
jgi:hypothetical protein